MQLPWERRAKAAHFYRRESATAMPRLRALGRIQAWRAGDGDQASPVRAVAPSGPAQPLAEELPHAA
jgi:hypothetical protein